MKLTDILQKDMELFGFKLASMAIIEAYDSVLLGRVPDDVDRGRLHGKWCLPGGRLHLLEFPRKAAIRETFEETGAVIDYLRFFSAKITLHGAYAFYLGKQVGGNLKSQKELKRSGEFIDLKYIPKKQIHMYCKKDVTDSWPSEVRERLMIPKY